MTSPTLPSLSSVLSTTSASSSSSSSSLTAPTITSSPSKHPNASQPSNRPAALPPFSTSLNFDFLQMAAPIGNQALISSSSAPSTNTNTTTSATATTTITTSSSSSSSFLFGKSNPLATLGLDPLSDLIMQGTQPSQENPPDTLIDEDYQNDAILQQSSQSQQHVQPKIDLNLHPSGILPVLQNIVATVNLGCKLDLKNIALHARNAEYNPKRFAAVIMRIREPKTTALIFASGKMVVTGAKSEDLSRLAARKYARIIQKLGFKAKFTDFKIQNIVGSCDVKFPIRLEGLAYSHGQFSSYEPELFPGLIYRMIKPKIVLLIFVSGKIVLTGAKVREEIYEAFEKIYPVLSDFKKIS